MMNYLDVIVIYLACGAPFCVYYFLKNNKHKKGIWLRSMLIFVLWIPFAFQLLHIKVTNKLNKKSNNSKLKQLLNLQKEFERFLVSSKSEISLFQLREVFERYRELTLISAENNGIPAKHEKEIFRINGNKAIQIPSLCLNRINHRKLLFHQIQARTDFFKLLNTFLTIDGESKKLGVMAYEFVKILDDEPAQVFVKKLFENKKQNDLNPSVTYAENDLWTTQEQKLLTTKQISIPLQVMTATANLQKKD